MKWQCYSIDGNSFHFGRVGSSQEECSIVFPSDSLFAAIVHTAAQTEEKKAFDAWIDCFNSGDPAFLLTSAFPRAGGIRFFPMPQLHEHIDFEALGITLKDIKKTSFISEGLFRRILTGEPTSIIYDPTQTKPIQGKNIRISLEEYDKLPVLIKKNQKIWEKEERPRVTLDRANAASNIFFSGIVTFAPECGLWFGVSNRRSSEIQLDILLKKTEDQGLGGLRSYGIGACKITKSDLIELPDSKQRRWILLSRYLPTEDEVSCILQGDTAFNLEEVGGWLYSPKQKAERRRIIHMISEGAVLSHNGKALYGTMTDVQPNYSGTQPVGHPVWRNGFAAGVSLAERQVKPCQNTD